jgi:uncharacterized membrane protein YphA (DoxX/SURF4 family)
VVRGCPPAAASATLDLFAARRRRPGSSHLQRFFSTFPGSAPGLGLLLLRAAVGGLTAAQGAAYLAANPGPGAALLAVLAIGSGAALVIGLLTPWVAIAAGLATTAIVATWAPAAPSFALDGMTTLLLVADALAIALLGPGAHSLDAHLFGRREIVIAPGPTRR